MAETSWYQRVREELKISVKLLLRHTVFDKSQHRSDVDLCLEMAVVGLGMYRRAEKMQLRNHLRHTAIGYRERDIPSATIFGT